MNWMKYRRALKEKLLGVREPVVLKAIPWSFKQRDGVDFQIRHVVYRLQYSKFPWYKRGEIMAGYQFNDPKGYPIPNKTARDAITLFISISRSIDKYNAFVIDSNERYRQHQNLRAEMGIK